MAQETMRGLEIQTQHGAAGAAVPMFRLSGYVDGDTYPKLEQELRKAVEAGATNVVLDVRRLNYANSMAWGLVLAMHKRLAKNGGGMVVAGLSGEMAGVFRLMGLNAVLTVFPDPDAAFAALNSAPATG